MMEGVCYMHGILLERKVHFTMAYSNAVTTNKQFTWLQSFLCT